MPVEKAKEILRADRLIPKDGEYIYSDKFTPIYNVKEKAYLFNVPAMSVNSLTFDYRKDTANK